MRYLLFSLPVLFMISCAKEAQFSQEDLSVNGSLSRFAIYQNHLYCLNANKLQIYDARIAENPTYLKSILIDFGLETIFIHNGILYIGANNGIHVLDLAIPSSPNYRSKIEHMVARDPVVVSGRYAYSTTHSPQFGGRLTTYDAQNPDNLIEVHSISMLNPSGLAVKDGFLYVCDEEGVFTFELSSPNLPTQVGQLSTIPNPKDVMLIGGSMLVSAESGFYILDYSNPANLSVVAQIQ